MTSSSDIVRLRAGPGTASLTKWGWVFALGVVYLITGFVALGSVALATMASVVLVGVMMIVAGVAEMINAFQVKTSGKFLLCALLGALYIVAGLVTAASSDTHPDGRGQHANSYQNPRQALPADLAQQPLHALAIDGMALARSIAVTRREPRNGQLTNSSSIRSISAESSSSLRARPIDA